ncbi:LysR substrate-binding domain-containing protein, partial [Pandoraea apista]
LDVLRRYPLIQACLALDNELLRQLNCPTQHASSFELMAVLVAAGYGVGVSLSSRISQAHNWGIVKRPLAGGPYSIRAQLLWPRSRKEPAIDRFAERAAKITAASRAT